MFREKLYLRGGILTWAHEDMSRQKVKLSLPAIRKFRDAIANGNIGTYLVESGEKANAGSVKVTYTQKNCPWVVTIEARRIKNSKH